MGDVATYKIVSSGECLAGFDPEQVKRTLAAIFNLSADIAGSTLQGKRVLKQGLPKDKADVYKKRLTVIGLDIVVEPEITGLRLQPLKGEVVSDSRETLETKLIACPKCTLEQPPGNQCCGCGVSMPKVQASLTESHFSFNVEKKSHPVLSENLTDGSSNLSLYLPAVVAALLGATLWVFVALAFGYELGAIAWAVGGLIGYAAMHSGTRGVQSGVVCGLLALLAIFGGKYAATHYAHQNTLSSLQAVYVEADLYALYEAEKRLAEVYLTQVHDETSLKQFMMRNGYVRALDITDIRQDDIQYFAAYTAPRLVQLGQGAVSMEAWADASVNSTTEQVSTFEILRDGLRALDLLFLLLGVGTAYRLARGSA